MFETKWGYYRSWIKGDGERERERERDRSCYFLFCLHLAIFELCTVFTVFSKVVELVCALPSRLALKK